ncbi:Glyoxylase, beta-lactamase superfamily II [Virgibacillus subterraneus]|uniref:Glyoxylase, beta-lactamase superfamily II n=1 Tax=Virgibacillus subterraneus TaxID=621109 RepID=A0A1H9BDX8_9BACI|nr:MBL fold metallo-hydrolase [Virgibacillus subterraneus]SEP87154.1 Glyoxylase, beta-lactamase superfamily II [Virgibacillus subterraneus]
MKKINYEELNIQKIAVHPFYRMMKVYLYFVDGVLVDTGPSVQRRNLIRAFRSWDIRQVAITHCHEDHIGMLQWVANNFSVNIYSHTKAVPTLNKQVKIPWYRGLLSSHRYDSKVIPYPDTIQTSKFEFLPIETPGHSSDHVCLLEPNKGWLFSGDFYVTPYPKVFSKGESIASYIDSLQKLGQYNFKTVLCAHEGVVPNGKEMMERKLDYLQSTRYKVIQLHQKGYTDKEIIKFMFPEKVKLELMSFGSFTRLNFIRSCYQE